MDQGPTPFFATGTPAIICSGRWARSLLQILILTVNGWWVKIPSLPVICPHKYIQNCTYAKGQLLDMI